MLFANPKIMLPGVAVWLDSRKDQMRNVFQSVKGFSAVIMLNVFQPLMDLLANAQKDSSEIHSLVVIAFRMFALYLILAKNHRSV